MRYLRFIRHLSKLAAGRQKQGASEHKTAAYTQVCEALSTEATQRLPLAVVFRKMFIVIWLILFSSLALANSNATGNVSLSPDLALAQQQLSQTTNQLTAISNTLSTPGLPNSTLRLMQEQVEGVLARVQQLQNIAEKKADEINTLINALGIPPKPTDPPEDPITAAKRKELTTTLAFYQSQTRQATALMSQSLSLSNALIQKRLENKAKGLMQRSMPLYDPVIWTQGVTQSNEAMLTASTNTFKMFKRSVDTLATFSMALLFGSSILIIALFGFVLYWFSSRYWGKRFASAKPALARKITTAVGIIVSQGIIPLVAILLIVLNAKRNNIIYQGQWYILHNFCLMLGGYWIAYLLVQTILSPKLPYWRILQIKDNSAILLARQLYIFTGLAMLNWFISTISESIPFDFLLPCEFVLRTLACFSGLRLLKKQYWLNESTISAELDHANTAPPTTRSAQRAFIHYLRIASVLIFVTNPIFMLFGYIVLANFLFISFIETVAIVAILLGLHVVGYQILGELIGIKTKGLYCSQLDLRLNRNKQVEGGYAKYMTDGEKTDSSVGSILDETLNLSERSRHILHYWLVVALDICFFLAGTTAILLSFGLSKQDLWRFIKPLFLGFNIGSFHFSLSGLFMAIVTFGAFFIITRLLQRFFNRRVFPYTNLDVGIQQALYQGMGYIGITIGFFVSIGMIGINLTSLALIAGALSVGIGFGLQNIVSNFIAGIIVLVERPIKLGDRIIVGQDEGTVKRISVRATELEASDGSSVLIPNSELISGRVRNWTFRNPLTKLDVAIGIAYGSDTRQVEQLLIQVAKQHPHVMRDPLPAVTFSNFGASSMDFRLTVCVNEVNKRNSTASDLRFAIEKAFKDNKIDIPFPQYDIRIVQPG